MAEWRVAETARKKARLLRRTAAAAGTTVAVAGESDASEEEEDAGAGAGTTRGQESQFKVRGGGLCTGSRAACWSVHNTLTLPFMPALPSTSTGTRRCAVSGRHPGSAGRT